MRKCLILAMLLLAQTPAHATDDLPGATTDETATSSGWSPFGDLMLRYDRVNDIPRPVDADIHGAFGRARLGVTDNAIPNLEFGAAIKLADSSIPNAENRSYNLNECQRHRADQALCALARCRQHFTSARQDAVSAGIEPGGLGSGSAPDRPERATSVQVGNSIVWEFTAGYFAGDCPTGRFAHRRAAGCLPLA